MGEQNREAKLKSLEAIFRALQEADARYLVVGGVAVIAHGYVRLTEDLYLVLALPSDSMESTLKALLSLGYREAKSFKFVCDRYSDVEIELIPKEPLAFDIDYSASKEREVAPNIRTRIGSIETLIAYKTGSSSYLDLIDIEKLRKLQSAGPMKVNEPSEPWPCGWESAELYQLRRDASRSFRENLIWLEEATEFAEAFAKAPWHKEGIKPSTPREE